MKPNNKFTLNNTKLRILLTFIVILGSINYGSTVLGYNLIEIFSTSINNLLNKNFPIDKIIYIIIAICGLLLAKKRSTWLPFLGKTVFPESLVSLKKPERSDTVVKIKTKPNTRVAYWASSAKEDNVDVITAYGNFSNGGVVMSNDKGIAELSLVSGSNYIVPSGYKIPRHVHYRTFNKSYGMMDKIKTQYY